MILSILVYSSLLKCQNMQLLAVGCRAGEIWACRVEVVAECSVASCSVNMIVSLNSISFKKLQGFIALEHPVHLIIDILMFHIEWDSN